MNTILTSLIKDKNIADDQEFQLYTPSTIIVQVGLVSWIIES